MEKGVTPAANGVQNMSWNIVGQTYVPKLSVVRVFGTISSLN